MRYGPVLLFTVLAAGAVIHGIETVRVLHAASSRGHLLPGRFSTPQGKSVTGYEYFEDTAAFLRREADRGRFTVLALAQDGEAGFWLSYLAYPALVRFVPFAYARQTLRNLPRVRTLLVIVPSMRGAAGFPADWPEQKVRSVLAGLSIGARPALRHESPFGLRVYEVRR